MYGKWDADHRRLVKGEGPERPGKTVKCVLRPSLGTLTAYKNHKVKNLQRPWGKENLISKARFRCPACDNITDNREIGPSKGGKSTDAVPEEDLIADLTKILKRPS